MLAAAILWGTTGTAQALAPPGAPPVVVGAVRLAIGGPALLLFALLRGRLQKPGSGQPANWLFAALGIAAYQLFFFEAVARTGVALGTVVTIGSAPILAGVLGRIFLGERTDRRWLAATLLGIGGTALLLSADIGGIVDPGGILLALGAGLSYSVYALSSKTLLEKQAPEAVAAAIFCLGALFLVPILVRADLAWISRSGGLVVSLHLGLIATAAAYILFSRGLQMLPVAHAVTLSLAEPLTAGALGVLLLGERLNTTSLTGAVLLLIGLLLCAGIWPARAAGDR